jgi:histidine phosphotransferase ChpT
MSEGFHVCNRSRGHCPILVMCPEPSRKASTWLISGEADRLEVDTELWRHLVRPSPKTEISPAHVQFALLSERVFQTGRQLQVEQTEQMLQVTL